MRSIYFVTSLFFLIQTVCLARVWTDLKGRKIEADVIKVLPNKMVKLKRKNGGEIVIAFSMFSKKDVLYLSGLLEKENKGTKEKIDRAEGSQSGGHICLIVGYNKKTKEVAISDSWGPRFMQRWVSIDEIKKVSYGTMVVIKW